MDGRGDKGRSSNQNIFTQVDIIYKILCGLRDITTFITTQFKKQRTYLAENEIIAIFWGECISSYG
jgi:hypothetical protein